MVLRPEKEEEAEAIFKKWGLDFAVVGITTDTLRFVVRHKGEVMADLPIKDLGDKAPEYDRPWVEPKRARALSVSEVPPPADFAKAILKITGSPDMCSRRWVYEQYDSLIQSNTAQIPGGDAGVVRISAKKAIAVSSDVTPRYVEADPYEGGKQAVAECWRNLTAVGADPIAATDNLNFGNPEKPEIMGQLVRAIGGIGEACRALDFPIVSGNVSLYNETNGQAILPTPTIGGVGLLPNFAMMATVAFKSEGDAIILIGSHGRHLGQSIYLRECLNREEGSPPPVDLAVEKRNGDFVRGLIRSGQTTAVHDISDGGLASALVEMALASAGLGASIGLGSGSTHGKLFGEDQARYVVTCQRAGAKTVLACAEAAGVPTVDLGSVAADTGLTCVGHFKVGLEELRAAHESWFPRLMA